MPIYPKWAEEVVKGTAGTALNGSGTTGLFAALIDTGVYTYSASHQFYSSISSAIIGTPVELGTKTYVDGVIDAANTTFTAVSGATTEAVALYISNAGANTTWRLFAFIPSVNATPNGSDIILNWNAAGIVNLLG